MGKGNVVTFEVSVPEGVATRSYTADGSNVNDLVYAVYSTEATTLEDAQNGPLKFFYAVNETTGTSFSDGKSVVSLELLNNQNYLILFWAQSNDAWVSAQGSDIDLLHVTYPSSMSANNMHLEAFSGVAFIQNVKGARKETVKLTRPFAQINLATTMPEAFTATLSQSSMTVTDAPAYFDVKKQSASVETTKEPLSFTAANVPDADFGKVGYEYAGANYIFAGAENTVNVEYKIYTSHGVVNNEVPSVPVQKNYRTNIIGNLLTSTAGYTVELDNRWGTPDYQVELWDGKTIKAVTPNENDNNIYEIDEPSELAWLAAAVNGTLPESKSTIAAQDFAGKTFRLTKDINLDNREWTPIGNGTAIFKGTFDGQNHTVKNLLINGSNKQDQGLFGVTHDGEIKNLVVENAMVSGRLNVGVVAGQPYTSKYTNITVKGHVEVNGMAYVGGVGGKNAYADWANIKVNVDETSYVRAHSIENGNAYRSYVGGVVGFNGEGGHSFKNITSNIDVKGSTIDVGGLFGIAHYGNQFENCSCSGDVEIYAAEEADEAQEIGGIAGVWNNGGENVVMTDCSFTGNLTTNIEGVEFYNGGLVGKPYSATGNGKLIIDGSVYVASAAELQAVLDAATEDITIKLAADIDGDVTINQKSDVDIVIDGLEKKYDGVIYIDGKNNYPSNETVNLTNINFETTHAESTEWTFVVGLTAGNSYPHNITIDGCTFKNTVANNFTVGSISFQQFYNLTVKNCTATNMHSLLQTQSCDNTVTVQNVTVIDGKNGISFGNTMTATISGSTIDAIGYGVRADGTDAREVSLTVTDCNINSYIPVVVRKLDADNVKKFTINVDESNTLTKRGEYHIALGSNEYKEGVAPIKPVSKYELNVADEFIAFPAPVEVATWDEFTTALGNGEDWIKLTADITYNKIYNINRGVNINLNGYTLTMSAPALYYQVSSAVSIKNGTIAGKLYAEKGSLTLSNVTFAGTVEGNSITGSLYIKAGNVLATDCVFNSQPSGKAEIRPLTIQTGANGSFKFVNCNFKSNGIQKQVYVNPVTANSTIEFERCTFNKTVNIDLPTGYSLMNLKLAGNKGGFTLGIYDRTNDSLITDYKDILDSYKNNNTGTLRIFYNGGSFYY